MIKNSHFVCLILIVCGMFALIISNLVIVMFNVQFVSRNKVPKSKIYR